ncbi:hypothetical protein Q3A80_07460 [Burkholderia sp. SR8]|uniref:hypothetical protein n=1 Tax=Burkholderia sp. SR8 TaxID=3062277 RepID=UPI004064A0E0
MLQTVKKGSSLHVAGRSAARISEAIRHRTPRIRRERPPHKACGPRRRDRRGGRRRPERPTTRRRPSGTAAPGAAAQPPAALD